MMRGERCTLWHGRHTKEACTSRGLCFSKGAGFEAPVAIVHHRDSHRNLAWRPIPQPWQTGSPGGVCRAGEVLRKSTRGSQNCAM